MMPWRNSGTALPAGVAELTKERAVTIEVALAERWRVADHNGDTARLFRNVLENAIHYSPSGGVVRIEASRQGDVIRVAIWNIIPRSSIPLPSIRITSSSVPRRA